MSLLNSLLTSILPSKTFTVNGSNPQPSATPSPSPKPIGQAITFSELSNVNGPKQLQELQAILNTAQNRAAQNKQTLLQILTAPNQYQGYGSQQYNTYFDPKKDYPSQQKAKLVDEYYQLAEQGKLKDITNGAKFYYHPQYNPNLANIGGAYFTKDYKDLQRIIKLDLRSKPRRK